MQFLLMKEYTENVEQKQQSNKQSLIYSGIKNIVKSSSGKCKRHNICSEHIFCEHNDDCSTCEQKYLLCTLEVFLIDVC